MFSKNTYKEDFKNHLERLGYSKNSQSMLPTCAAEFLSQLQQKNIYELQQITPEHIQDHYEYLTERPNKRRPGGLSSSMINHHIYAIKLFLNFLQETAQIKINPITGLSFPKTETPKREILTLNEIKQVYQICKTHKEKAILSLFYGCGLRRSEGEALNVNDVNLKNKVLYVRRGKGNKRRVIPMNKSVMKDLKNYQYYDRKASIHTQAFMVNNAGSRMKGSTCNNIVKELINRAEIDKSISLHSLRHSIATHLLENGLSIEYVRDFLGHKHLEATQIYTEVSKRKLYNL